MNLNGSEHRRVYGTQSHSPAPNDDNSAHSTRARSFRSAIDDNNYESEERKLNQFSGATHLSRLSFMHYFLFSQPFGRACYATRTRTRTLRQMKTVNELPLINSIYAYDEIQTVRLCVSVCDAYRSAVQ